MKTVKELFEELPENDKVACIESISNRYLKDQVPTILDALQLIDWSMTTYGYEYFSALHLRLSKQITKQNAPDTRSVRNASTVANSHFDIPTAFSKARKYS